MTTAVTATRRRGGAAAPPSIACRVTAYARAVLAGEIVAGRFVRLACERHLDDLEHGARRGLRWNQAEADAAIDFFGYLRQWKGRWQGEPLELLPWQQFVAGSVFGWQRWDDALSRWVRRFRESYTSVARKNGKTTMAAGVGLWLLDFDGEAGAEVYAAASKRDQARQCWDAAERIVAQSPSLRRRIEHVRSEKRLVVAATGSFFLPLGRDSDSEHGLNPHGALIDELHVHPKRDMVDALETAVGARVQPLIWYITTAGVEGESIYTETEDRARRVVQGITPDDRMFVYVATLDEDDDWTDPAVYVKANPSLGATVQLEELIAERDKAVKTPGRQNTFKRLRLNMRTGQETAWLDPKAWDECRVEALTREGATAIGVDLGGTRDLSAAARVTLDEDGGLDIDVRFWMPEARLEEAEERDQVPYRAWVEAGYITATPGDYRDDAAILEDLIAFGSDSGAREVDMDAWQMGHIATQLVDRGVEVVKVPQTYPELAPATEAFETAIAKRALGHLGNPVMRWMVASVSVEEYPDGAKKPSKKGAMKHRKHIDGVSAVVTALARLVRMEDEKKPKKPRFYSFPAGDERR